LQGDYGGVGRGEAEEPAGLCLRYQYDIDVFVSKKISSTLTAPEGSPMGKTLPPSSELIEYERRRWTPFKRALPKVDQARFDRLFDCAKLHVQAGVCQSRPVPLETIILAVLLEQQKRIEELLHTIQQLRAGAGECWSLRPPRL
jgi:hypothetical protein